MKPNRWITVCFISIPLACVAQLSKPVQRGELYELSCMKDQHMQIDPKLGARITSLTIGNKNFLTDSSVNKDNWGSTCWPSPQSHWNWPPPASWDNHPYTVKQAGENVIMESVPDPGTGLSVSKIYSADATKGLYQIEYIITNHSNTIRKVAPWEVTRVHPNGFSFFPMGKGQLRGGLIPQTKMEKGICWFIYDQQKIPEKGDTQIYTDGAEGWFAEVNAGVILIKKFPDIPFEAIAPQEGEVELYANKDKADKSYVEIEHQGAYTELQPGKKFSWTMQWLLRNIPSGIKAVPGNPALVEYVRGLLK